MRFVLVLGVLAACSGRTLVTSTRGGSVLFRDVRVFDVERARWTPPSCVRFEGPTISGMMVEPCALTADRVHSGGFLTPGLSDLHVHVSGDSVPPTHPRLPRFQENLESFLYAGVTTVFDVAGAFNVMDLRDEIAAGTRLGPRIFATGPMLTTEHGHVQAVLEAVAPWPLSWVLKRRITRTITTPSEAASTIEELVEHKADAVKIAVDHLPLPQTPVLDAERVRAIVDAAHAKGLKVVAHIGASDDAQNVVAANVDALVHGVYVDRASDEVIAQLAAKKIPVACTLSVFHNMERMLTQAALTPFELELGDKSVVAALSAPQPDDDVKTWAKAVQASRAHRIENCRRMWQAGVPMLVGSDSPNVSHFAGAGTHVELRELAAMGMPNAEVLRAATATNARFLKGNFGVIAPGKAADLLWLDRDPLLDLDALSKPKAVVAAGQWLERVKL
jgi:imidazolonepropionase-like amidohydrolase